MSLPKASKKRTTPKHKCSFLQQEHKAGLHVSTAWKKARDDCIAQVAAIVERCKAQNRKFRCGDHFGIVQISVFTANRDIEFDLENDKEICLYGVNPGDANYEPTGTRRVTQIFDDPQLFTAGGAHPSDIIQGRLDDCWFLSALATMSSAEQHPVEKICVAVRAVFRFFFQYSSIHTA